MTLRMHSRWTLFIASAMFALVPGMAQGRSFRTDQVPNGPVNGCLTCHVTPGGLRNHFGQTIEDSFLDGPGGNVVWGAALAALDSDNDGRSNGAELLDPAGAWRSGAGPGTPSQVTNPGVANPPSPKAVPALPVFAALGLAGLLCRVGVGRLRR